MLGHFGGQRPVGPETARDGQRGTRKQKSTPGGAKLPIHERFLPGLISDGANIGAARNYCFDWVAL
jgi:hypothetical protein